MRQTAVHSTMITTRAANHRTTRRRSPGEAVVRAPRRRHGAEAGQSVVEFAVILPVALMLLLITIDFGRVFYVYISLVGFAREGALYCASQGTTPATVPSDRVLAGLGSRLAPTVTEASCQQSTVTVGTSDTATVVVATIRAQVQMVTPYVSNVTGNPKSLSVTATVPRGS
jgi:hypothetical protein